MGPPPMAKRVSVVATAVAMATGTRMSMPTTPGDDLQDEEDGRERRVVGGGESGAGAGRDEHARLARG